MSAFGKSFVKYVKKET